MADELITALRRFRTRYFPRYRREYRQLIEEGEVLILDVEKGTFEATDIAPSGNRDDGAAAVHQLQ